MGSLPAGHSGIRNLFETPEEAAAAIKDKVKEQLGFTVNVGYECPNSPYNTHQYSLVQYPEYNDIIKDDAGRIRKRFTGDSMYRRRGQEKQARYCFGKIYFGKEIWCSNPRAGSKCA